MTIAQARALQRQLEKVFKHHKLDVNVTITGKGVSIVSRDSAVYASISER